MAVKGDYVTFYDDFEPSFSYTSMELHVLSESVPLKRTRQSVQNLVLVSQSPQYLIGVTSFPNIAKTSCERNFSFSFRRQQSLQIRIEAF